MSQNKSLTAYLALGVGIISLSFSAMFVRRADAPAPITTFYRLFFSIFLLLPFFLPRLRTEQPIRSQMIVFPLLAGVFTAFDLALWTASLSKVKAVAFEGHGFMSLQKAGAPPVRGPEII